MSRFVVGPLLLAGSFITNNIGIIYDSGFLLGASGSIGGSGTRV
ncbi:MAG: hypothetical protein Q7J85_11770 [Bacillota bacterium]|nr:hypothetical protein [Bacillota bacterium]